MGKVGRCPWSKRLAFWKEKWSIVTMIDNYNSFTLLLMDPQYSLEIYTSIHSPLGWSRDLRVGKWLVFVNGNTKSLTSYWFKMSTWSTWIQRDSNLGLLSDMYLRDNFFFCWTYGETRIWSWRCLHYLATTKTDFDWEKSQQKKQGPSSDVLFEWLILSVSLEYPVLMVNKVPF